MTGDNEPNPLQLTNEKEPLLRWTIVHVINNDVFIACSQINHFIIIQHVQSATFQDVAQILPK